METLQQLNRVQLRGYIGSIKVQTVGCSKVARFSVATNYAYKDAQGYCVIETTWSNVVAQNITCLDSLKKGDAVDVVGRIRNQRYTDSNGNEHSAYEIAASKLELLNERLTMEM